MRLGLLTTPSPPVGPTMAKRARPYCWRGDRRSMAVDQKTALSRRTCASPSGRLHPAVPLCPASSRLLVVCHSRSMPRTADKAGTGSSVLRRRPGLCSASSPGTARAPGQRQRTRSRGTADGIAAEAGCGSRRPNDRRRSGGAPAFVPGATRRRASQAATRGCSTCCATNWETATASNEMRGSSG